MAGALKGVFSGFDVALHGAWLYDDAPRVRDDGIFSHDRLWFLGAGANYTWGSWLLKGELAYLDGYRFAGLEDERSRLDTMLGIEYYGLRDTNIAIEGLNRHVFDHVSSIVTTDARREDTQEFAVRITRNFANERARATALAFWQSWDASDGSAVRLDLEYDVRDALTVMAGILLFQSGDLPLFGSFARNDRLIFRAKWSF